MNAMASDFRSRYQLSRLDDEGLSDLSARRGCPAPTMVHVLTAFCFVVVGILPSSQPLAPKLNQHKALATRPRAWCPSRPGFLLHRPVLSHAHDTGEAVFSLQTRQPVPDCCADGARRRRVSLRLPPHVVYAGLRAPVLVAARHPRLFPCGMAAPDPADCPLLPRWPDIRHANGEDTRRHAARRSSNQRPGDLRNISDRLVGLLPVLTDLGLTSWCLGRQTDLNRR